jgi:CheY-like chemotaxis protein
VRTEAYHARKVAGRKGPPTSLPASGGAGADVKVTENAGPARPPTRDAAESPVVIVVDDDACIRFVAARAITRLGYRVFAAENGAEGLALYKRHRGQVALVVTDMMMPVMDGPSLVAALVRIDPGVRILVSSGCDTAQDRGKFLMHGVTHFLPKPYAPEALAKAVAGIAGGAAPRRVQAPGAPVRESRSPAAGRRRRAAAPPPPAHRTQ